MHRTGAQVVSLLEHAVVTYAIVWVVTQVPCPTQRDTVTQFSLVSHRCEQGFKRNPYVYGVVYRVPETSVAALPSLDCDAEAVISRSLDESVVYSAGAIHMLLCQRDRVQPSGGSTRVKRMGRHGVSGLTACKDVEVRIQLHPVMNGIDGGVASQR